MSLLNPSRRDRQIQNTVAQQEKIERTGRLAYRQAMRNGDYGRAMNSLDWVSKSGGNIAPGIRQAGQLQAKAGSSIDWATRQAQAFNGVPVGLSGRPRVNGGANPFSQPNPRPTMTGNQPYNPNATMGGTAVPNPSQPGQPNQPPQPGFVDRVLAPAQSFLGGIRNAIFGDASSVPTPDLGPPPGEDDRRAMQTEDDYYGDEPPEGYTWTGYKQGRKRWTRNGSDSVLSSPQTSSFQSNSGNNALGFGLSSPRRNFFSSEPDPGQI